MNQNQIYFHQDLPKSLNNHLKMFNQLCIMEME